MRPAPTIALLAVALVILVGVGYAGRQSMAAAEPVVAKPVDTGTPAPGGDAVWLTDYAQALAASKATGKPLFMDFTGSDWCPGCKLLHEEVFATPEFAAWAARSVILLEVDFPRKKPQPEAVQEQNLKLSDKYQIEVFPTVLVVSPDGKELVRASYVPNVTAKQWIGVVAKAAGLAP